MKITKKKVGLGVAVIIALGILWTVLQPAPAEAADVDFTFGAEKKVNANTNKMYLDSSVDLPLGVKGTSGVNYSVDNSLDATFDSFELDELLLVVKKILLFFLKSLSTSMSRRPPCLFSIIFGKP